eukprot:10466017-Ditylum_brightwellii.AAC.1
MDLPVEEVLISNHPSPTQPSEEALCEYENIPTLIDIDVTEDTVENVGAKMQGAAGPGGVGSIAWRDWILRYGIASRRLRKGV